MLALEDPSLPGWLPGWLFDYFALVETNMPDWLISGADAVLPVEPGFGFVGFFVIATTVFVAFSAFIIVLGIFRRARY